MAANLMILLATLLVVGVAVASRMPRRKLAVPKLASHRDRGK